MCEIIYWSNLLFFPSLRSCKDVIISQKLKSIVNKGPCKMPSIPSQLRGRSVVPIRLGWGLYLKARIFEISINVTSKIPIDLPRRDRAMPHSTPFDLVEGC